MSEYSERQGAILRDGISLYRAGSISLSMLVSYVEGVRDAIESEILREKIFEIILVLEQINADKIVNGGEFDENDRRSLSEALFSLDILSGEIGSLD